jgi:hypothetical protein
MITLPWITSTFEAKLTTVLLTQVSCAFIHHMGTLCLTFARSSTNHTDNPNGYQLSEQELFGSNLSCYISAFFFSTRIT